MQSPGRPMPVSINPALHVHVKLPVVSAHAAFISQGPGVIMHSFMSVRIYWKFSYLHFSF